MGYHLVTRVYDNVHGTSSTAQAVLAYLAHRADDKGEWKCYPSIAQIEEATHFKHTAIGDALNELRESKLLTWVTGGRHKGDGGRSLANEYTFNLPVVKSAVARKQSKSSIRHTDSAVSATRIVQSPPDGNCSLRQADTINQCQIENQPSVNGATEAGTDDLVKKFAEIGDAWKAPKKPVSERAELKRKSLTAVVEEAMAAVGVGEFTNRQIFTSTMLRRDMEDCLEVIRRFESERRAGEHKGLNNPAGMLNHLLSQLPTVC